MFAVQQGKHGRGAACLVVVLVTLVVLSLATGLATAEEEKIKLHYLTWAGGASADYIREDFIEPFQKLHPNIEITYEAVSFANFPDKYLTYYIAGNAPDLIHLSVGWVYDWAEKGMLTNLQPLFNRDLNPNLFFAEPLNAMRYPSMSNGDLYGMPFAFVLTSLFYNKTMFDNRGLQYPTLSWSWNDTREAAKKLVRDVDGDGKTDAWGFYSAHTYTTLDPIIHSFGGSILDDNFNVTLDQPKAVDAARFMVDLIHKDGVAPNPAVVSTSGINLFAQGNMGMLIENISQISLFRQSQFDWDVAVMPTGPEKRVVRLWPDSFGISSQSKNVEAAWEYVKFVVTQKEMDRYSGSRKVPIYRPLAISPEWLEKDQLPNKMMFIEAIAYGDPLEFRPRWGEWNDLKGNALAPAWRGQMAIETAMKNAADAIRRVLASPTN
jgi:multiple sugar transport system substrate-binding protein